MWKAREGACPLVFLLRQMLTKSSNSSLQASGELGQRTHIVSRGPPALSGWTTCVRAGKGKLVRTLDAPDELARFGRALDAFHARVLPRSACSMRLTHVGVDEEGLPASRERVDELDRVLVVLRG